MTGISIRLTLTAWYSAVLMAGIAIFGFGTWSVLEHRLLDGLDARLAQRLQGLRVVLEVESSGASPTSLREELGEYAREGHEGELIHLKDEVGSTLLPPSSPHGRFAGLESLEPVYRTVSFEGTRYRVLTMRLSCLGRNYQALAGGSIEEIAAAGEDFRRIAVLMGALSMVLAGLGGYWLSGRALKPVDDITREARAITVQNLSRRLVVPRAGDEIQRLSETWNDVSNPQCRVLAATSLN